MLGCRSTRTMENSHIVCDSLSVTQRLESASAESTSHSLLQLTLDSFELWVLPEWDSIETPRVTHLRGYGLRASRDSSHTTQSAAIRISADSTRMHLQAETKARKVTTRPPFSIALVLIVIVLLTLYFILHRKRVF